ncbi:hypothetical protein GW17_00033917 [Ensete ventricosum]|nr:hypothetical protein GW17_00033917 [Ensete ventricosum]RZS08898.1 hypothetical protein BHM03_00039933 [Ensete ventricosum]
MASINSSLLRVRSPPSPTKRAIFFFACYLIIFALWSSSSFDDLDSKAKSSSSNQKKMGDYETPRIEKPRQVVKKVLARSQPEGVGATCLRLPDSQITLTEVSP